MAAMMDVCPSCNRHVREEACPFCGAKCVHSARFSIGRVARFALVAAGAAALSECTVGQALYGAVCPPDAECGVPPYEASTSDTGSDAPFDAKTDAPTDAATDTATDAAADSASDAASDSASD